MDCVEFALQEANRKFAEERNRLEYRLKRFYELGGSEKKEVFLLQAIDRLRNNHEQNTKWLVDALKARAALSTTPSFGADYAVGADRTVKAVFENGTIVALTTC